MSAKRAAVVHLNGSYFVMREGGRYQVLTQISSGLPIHAMATYPETDKGRDDAIARCGALASQEAAAHEAWAARP